MPFLDYAANKATAEQDVGLVRDRRQVAESISIATAWRTLADSTAGLAVMQHVRGVLAAFTPQCPQPALRVFVLAKLCICMPSKFGLVRANRRH